MQFPTRFVLYVAVQNYLTVEKSKELLTDLGRRKLGDKEFINTIKKHFDIELFRTKPFIWQDIWIYNYLMYEATTRLVRSKLINRYSKEIITPQKFAIDEVKNILAQLNDL